MSELYVSVGFPECQDLQEKEGFSENSDFCAESNTYYVRKDWLDKRSQIDTCQAIADKVTSAIMGYFFGDRFRNCDYLEDDYEMNHAWEYFNDLVYETIISYYGDDESDS